jgi:hypothetical protein
MEIDNRTLSLICSIPCIKLLSLFGKFISSDCNLIPVTNIRQKQLMHLILEPKWSQVSQVSDEQVIYLTRGCLELESINFRNCKDITDASLAFISQNCPKITSIDTSMCYNLTDEGLIAIMNGCRNLQHLILSDCHITDACLLSLSTLSPHLERLILCRCRRITDVGAVAIARSCPALTDLNLFSCKIAGGELLRTLGANTHRLRLLVIQCTLNTNANANANTSTNANEGVVNVTNNVTNDDVSALAIGCPLLDHLTILVGDWPIFTGAGAGAGTGPGPGPTGRSCTDASLICILSNCASMHVLHLQGWYVTSASLAALYRHSVKNVRFHDCFGLNEMEIDYLRSSAKNVSWRII